MRFLGTCSTGPLLPGKARQWLSASQTTETASSDSKELLASPEPSNHYPHCHGESCPCETCEAE